MRDEGQGYICSGSLSEGTSPNSFPAPLLGCPGAGGPSQSTKSQAVATSLLPTYFSLSPSHFDIRSEDDTEKKVELLASVATALAR